MRLLRLYGLYVVVILKGLMEYRLNFFLDFLALFINNIFAYASVWIIMTRFVAINGWTLFEVMVLVGLYEFCWGVCGLFIRSPLLTVEHLVRDGKFDNVMTKPIPTLVHIILMKFNHIWFSNMITGMVVLLISFRELGIRLGAAEVFWLAVTLLCGVMIMSGLIIMIGTLSFRFIRAGSMGGEIFGSLAEFVRYPITIYPWVIQLLLTVIPFAFINFYPAHLFLDRAGDGGFAPALRYGAPPVAVATLALSVLLWNAGIKRYQSTGS
ncbi:MAG: ABC-2 family transporter protein [Spirochaetaceae bacterium]|nr:ABC-2 family transporter protein [Spirochaetaceae bacterium]